MRSMSRTRSNPPHHRLKLILNRFEALEIELIRPVKRAEVFKLLQGFTVLEVKTIKAVYIYIYIGIKVFTTFLLVSLSVHQYFIRINCRIDVMTAGY